MHRALARTALLVASLLAFPACDSNDDDDDGGSVGPGEGSTSLSGGLSGSLDGSSYAAFTETGESSFITVALFDSDVASGDLDTYTGDVLAMVLFPNGEREGGYTISLFGGLGGTRGGVVVYGEDVDASDDPQYAANSGTVTLTSVSDTRIAGSFNVSLTDLTGGSGGRARGSFDAIVTDDIAFGGGDGGGGGTGGDLPSCADPAPLSLPGSVDGEVSGSDCGDPNLGDPADYYAFSVPSNRTVVIDQIATDITLDPYLALYSGSGAFITSNDDGGDGSDARISRSLTAGTYVVAASTFGSFGAYRLTVE